MVKAHSLLYAIYICLIVAIICGALLYFATLYTQLNLHYNLREEMYIHNQSVVNYALGNIGTENEFPLNEDATIKGTYTAKQYGLLTLLTVQTTSNNDTITSAYFAGAYSSDKTAIHLSNFSSPLSYSGNVKLIGDNYLPSAFIETAYINSQASKLVVEGKTMISGTTLPEINPAFETLFTLPKKNTTLLSTIEKYKDSLYYNSFTNETIGVDVGSVMSNSIFKGNFVLYAKDSIRIHKNAVLEDVIVIAPKITFDEGFSGTVQAFATKGIELGEKVTLKYPSVVCVYNPTKKESFIKIKSQCSVMGAIVLFGNAITEIPLNSIEVQEKCIIYGDIYCTGKLMLQSDSNGSVYTNRFFLQTQSSNYDNMIANVTINAKKRPDYFVSIPLFINKNIKHGLFKKVL